MPHEPIKILHVVFTLEPGGMENGLINVARTLDHNDFEVHVCCLERSGSFAERLPNPRNVHVLGKRPGFSLKTIFALRQLISKLEPDVLHSHNLGPLIYASLATFFGRLKPILHGEHGSLQPDQLLARRILARKFFYLTCRQIHTVSHRLTEQLRETGFPSSRVVTLINGVDAEKFRPASRTEARKKIGLPENTTVIGIVGRFVALKRHVDLLEAFNGLGKNFPNVSLLIVGGGGEKEETILFRVNSSPAGGRIYVTGFQKDPVLFYQAMDLLAVPSIHEGMSNVVLEAMACGVPVLSHNICGNAEVISSGTDGIVADLGSVEKLQTELEKALSDLKKLGLLGRLAREKIVKEHALERMVFNYENLYRKLFKS